jgi:DNA topoisomerase IB
MTAAYKDFTGPDFAGLDVDIAMDPDETAQLAGLRYITDALPGIARRRAGKGFRYITPDGTPVKGAATLARIKALVIPPAWKDVWICPSPRGHIQATGRDERGLARGARRDEIRAAGRVRRLPPTDSAAGGG